MSSDKKHGLGRGISSLFGGDFNLDEQVDNIISRTTGEKKPQTAAVDKPAKSVATPAEQKKSVDMTSVFHCRILTLNICFCKD